MPTDPGQLPRALSSLEERLPLLALRLPPWLLSQHPHLETVLRANQQQHFANFELHATLEALIRGDFGPPPANHTGTLSLFQVT